jgi:ribosomal protein S18 acetylase RimI-like enzyme
VTASAQASVRRATEADAEAIARVWVASWQVAYRGQVPDAFLDGLTSDLGRRTGIMRRILTEARERVLVSEHAGLVSGFVTFGPSRDDDRDDATGEVYAIYVHPAAWGTGTGRALLALATAGLRESGSSKATLWVLGTNERARRFYEAAGWTPDGATKDEERGSFTLHEVRYRRDPL